DRRPLASRGAAHVLDDVPGGPPPSEPGRPVRRAGRRAPAPTFRRACACSTRRTASMGDKTAIEWTDHTFNPWWGCVEVSPACDFCYARTWAQRRGHPVWGTDAPRRFFGEAHWGEPLRWNRRAAATGRRARVFCASMADVLEERHDPVGALLEQARARLWATIEATPNLDWLLLTKRPAGDRPLVAPEDFARVLGGTAGAIPA